MKTLLASAALLCALSTTGYAAGQLQLYNWGNYTSPELLKKFEDETGIKVTVTDYDSNDVAIAKVGAGGSGFDLVVPSANYVRFWVDRGLIQELDHSRLANIGNIAAEWRDVDWDPGRKFTIPWQWGSTGVAVNTSVYSGDINTSAIFLDPPAELVGKVNVVPEMSDVLALATMYAGGEPCSEDPAIMKKVRDTVLAAKPKWISMDYGATERLSNGDWAASVNWNGSTMRARINTEGKVQYGYPKEGYPLFMDSVALLSDAKNVDEAYKFIDFIMLPENAAMISAFARYANGIAGSEAFMPEDMKTAPEVVVPEAARAAGRFLPGCTGKALDYQTAIWTELQK
ncbi:putrescine/spermidine ABC transporter substrate-binding protein [Haematobacter massiliensis]|uniref:Putrescine-binding periplasmic protein n=1 Tax=Haematobacter massiliensis TaxID=195105 RepID=A0A086Y6V1_9RHOB|nr:extracellular solute-binding protein [Haematobacter massiliensis]KFI30001.1 putrescine/spermidine ABC transporter substrate-binding protein [Haematobacter massiliensis]OWJ69406.1 putrescine/spermidine ABC transporter substrate-binding protein [Haematobacter massiliensis]OWJ86937.1 putrescine/spermidine ABC transporter substrate-binding protein [Haematobacter massiliensis]QBJ25506.1 extracellular solute-binding protein [Haematobacter massiliensis]